MANPQPPNMPAFMLPNMGVAMVYFNGFNIGLTNSEISAFLLHDGQPAVKAVMPLSTAKSLMNALSELIEKYETATSTKVFSNDELIALISEQSK